MALKIEQLGPYRIGRQLGRGGMGAVFEGVNTVDNSRVAVKVLAPAFSDEAGFRDRFTAEIDMLKHLKHPNIVQLLAWGEQGELLFYAMELVDGTTLEAELQLGRKFEWREVTQFAIKLCKALKHAHDRGIVHRDVKPANLLLTIDSEIKLSDFGIGRLFGGTRITSAGGLIGTAEYMSPEQADGRNVTDHSDLYSLGCVMFALLAGRAPFQSHSLPEMLQMQRFAVPPPLSRFAPDVPEELAQIIHRLLDKDPLKRVPNANVLSRQLAAMEHGLSLYPKDDALPTDVTQVAPSGLVLGSDSKASELNDPNGVTRELGQPTQVPKSSATAMTSALPAARESTSNGQSPNDIVVRDDRFTTLAEEAAQQAKNRQNGESSSALQIVLMVAALAAVVLGGWMAFKPLSAEKLLGKITTAASDERSDRVLDVEDDINAFLLRFPDDPNADKVAEYKKRVDRLRLERRFRRQGAKSLGDRNVSPVQRDYLAAIADSDANPQRAAERLRAVIDLYNDPGKNDDATQEIVDLAAKEIGQLQERIKLFAAAHLKLLDARLKRADELHASDPEKAAAIRRGVLELYSDKPWAADAVNRAKAGLDGKPVAN